MKKIMIVSAIVIAMTGISTAQANDHYDDRGDHRGNQHKSQQHDNRGGNTQWKGQRFHAPAPYVRPHGYQVRTWRGGDRLPPAYRSSRYHVDYRQYHLNAPPRGYQYVRVNNDVILTAIATGVIASVITGMYY